MPFSVDGKDRLAHYWQRSEDEIMEWGIQRAKRSPTNDLTWRIFKRADWWRSINLIGVSDEQLEWIIAFYIWNKKEEGDLPGLNERLKEHVKWLGENDQA